MTGVAIFPGPIFRAIVVEQLNRDQWHVVLQGQDVSADALEGQPGGVASFAGAVADAIHTADYTGLPVLIAPYQQETRPLASPPSSPAFWHHRFRRSMGLDDLMYGPAMFGGAA